MAKSLPVKIKDLEKKYRIVTDNLQDVIWVIDAETLKYEYITPSIEKMSGFTVEEYSQLTIRERLAPGSLKKVMAEMAKQRKRFEQGVKSISKLEVEPFHRDGHTYWVEIKARFLKESGKSLKIIGVMQDITERKRAEQQKEDTLKQLANALAEKERLLKEIKILRGLLPICSGCKRIRDENGRWWPLDAYVTEQTEAKLTHTICNDCKEVFYGDL